MLCQDIFKWNSNEGRFCENKLVSMALFLSLNKRQGNERFVVDSRGNQCAFMTILTAQNMPLKFERVVKTYVK